MRFTALVLLTLAVATPGTAGAQKQPTVRKVATACPDHVKGVYYYRGQTRSYERKLGRRPSKSVFNASTITSCRYTIWVAHHWKRKLSKVREDYIEYLASQRKAAAATRSNYVGTGYSSYCGAACIQCESGGNPQAVSPGGTYWGLYQFDYGTWVAHGGSPSAYGNADAATQHAIASRVQYQAWPVCGYR